MKRVAMSPTEHYLEAERLLDSHYPIDLARAQVHAALASAKPSYYELNPELFTAEAIDATLKAGEASS